MLKKAIAICFIIIIMLGICGTVFASDTYTTTSTINGTTVNWEYKLNASNQIEELKCTNPTEIKGKLTIPSILDEKTVISLGDSSFQSATNITEIIVPNTIKTIGTSAFSGCTSLEKVDLGNVEEIKNQSFRNCTSLTNIVIPKTINKGASGAPFSGCTNLTTIQLEEGMTIVPNYICANTPITEIIIPNTVKEIGLWAFSGCTSLAKVDLGKVEEIKDQSFANCTSLTSIVIPKTISKGASGAPFSGCTNLTTIQLEEGMTIVPNYICASTPITEIAIPNTVTEIGLWAFKSCTSLKKIKILDNVEKMGGYSSSNLDCVFENHNEDLTIYCYKDSMAAKYAIKYNIKYVYLSKPEEENPKDEPKKENQNTPKEENKKDDTVATEKLPNTGINIVIGISILATIGITIISYKEYNKYKKIR